MAKALWTFTEREHGYREVTGPNMKFVRWRWGHRWEAYTGPDFYTRGSWVGRERFYRLLSDAECAALDANFERAKAAERLGPLGVKHAHEVAQREALRVRGCVFAAREMQDSCDHANLANGRCVWCGKTGLGLWSER